MLGLILLVLPAGLRFLSLCRGARVSAAAVAADPAVRAKSRVARAPRPRGSHLGKSGWRPGHCAGPSSHWAGCWPSPAGSTAWFGRAGRAGARGQDASGSGSRGPRSQRASARPRGARAGGELSRSLRFRGEVPAPGRGRGEDTGHPLGGPSPPAGPRAAPPCGWWAGRGRGQSARVGAPVPLGGSRPGPGTEAPLTRGAPLGQAAATRRPPPRSPEPRAHRCGPSGWPRL